MKHAVLPQKIKIIDIVLKKIARATAYCFYVEFGLFKTSAVGVWWQFQPHIFLDHFEVNVVIFNYSNRRISPPCDDGNNKRIGIL